MCRRSRSCSKKPPRRRHAWRRSMRSLLEYQRKFSEALLSKEQSAAWGLAAYRRNVFGNWSGALANAYPIVRKIVGGEFFDAMAREYAREHPSTSGDLNEFGARLPGFVAACPHTRDLPYLPDVARMEWLAPPAPHPPHPPPFDAKTPAAPPPENNPEVKFKLAPRVPLKPADLPLA